MSEIIFVYKLYTKCEHKLYTKCVYKLKTRIEEALLPIWNIYLQAQPTQPSVYIYISVCVEYGIVCPLCLSVCVHTQVSVCMNVSEWLWTSIVASPHSVHSPK